jgi:hypothetical protein
MNAADSTVTLELISGTDCTFSSFITTYNKVLFYMKKGQSPKKIQLDCSRLVLTVSLFKAMFSMSSRSFSSWMVELVDFNAAF